MYKVSWSHISAEGVVVASGDEEENDDKSAQQVKSDIEESMGEEDNGSKDKEGNGYTMSNSTPIENVMLENEGRTVVNYKCTPNETGMFVIGRPLRLLCHYCN